MSKFPKKFLSVFLAVLMLAVSLSALAVTVAQSEVVSPSMQKSKRYINSIISEKNDSMQATLFSEFVDSRLKYVTVRSLSKCLGSKWMGYVDICEELDNGEHVAYILEQGVIQYGYDKLPSRTNAASISVGDVSSSIKFSGESVFSFDNMILGDDALDADISLSVEYYGNGYDIDLVESYPSSSLDRVDALLAMAPAYVEHVENSGEFMLVDHAFLKLKSYISNYDTKQRSYYWELYLVHGAELPAPATLIRYYVSTDSVKIYERTLRDYF